MAQEEDVSKTEAVVGILDTTPLEVPTENNILVSELDKAIKEDKESSKKHSSKDLEKPEAVVVKGKSIMDYYFYTAQRNEVGHLPDKAHPNGYYPGWYYDSNGNKTAGIGSVGGAKNAIKSDIEKKLNKTGKITRDEAIAWSRDEMLVILKQRCLEKFPNFEKMLPCYQAIIMDASYQGVQSRLEPLNEGNTLLVRKKLEKLSGNKERTATRLRLMDMGIEIERYRKEYPNANPKDVATSIALELIKKDKKETNPDARLTRDELAMLYHSCNAAYGVPTDDKDVEAFALSFKGVKTGFFGIGSGWQPENYEHYVDKPVLTAENEGSISQKQEKVLSRPMMVTLNDKTADLDWLVNYSVEKKDPVNSADILALQTTMKEPKSINVLADFDPMSSENTKITLKHDFWDHPELKNLTHYDDKKSVEENKVSDIVEQLKSSGTDITENVTTTASSNPEVALPMETNKEITPDLGENTKTVTVETPTATLPAEVLQATGTDITIPSATPNVDCVIQKDLPKLPTEKKR